MKTTDLEIMSDPLSQPTRITRRSFVKRTGATVIVTVLALHAFRNEAMAAGADSQYSGTWPIKMEEVSQSVDGVQELGPVDEVIGVGEPNLRHQVLLTVSCTPDEPTPDTAPLKDKRSVAIDLTFDHETSIDLGLTWNLVDTLTATINVEVKNPEYPNDTQITWTIDTDTCDLSSTSMRVGLQIVNSYDRYKASVDINYIVGVGFQGDDLTSCQFIPDNIGKFDIKGDEDTPPALLTLESADELLDWVRSDDGPPHVKFTEYQQPFA